MQIKVTAKDIREAWAALGCEGASSTCPIARAVRRLPEMKGADVGLSHIISKGDRYRLPTAARRFISRFDDGLDVRPFTFNAPLVKP